MAALVDASRYPFSVGLATGQTLPWSTLVERWTTIEAQGFDSAWVFDHFMAAGGGSTDDTYLEAWTALAGLAALTPRVTLGVLVSGNTYRNPSLLAKQAVTVDQISGGRLVLGLGAGWHEREHDAYGFEFPAPGERVDRFIEAIQVVRSLMTNERSDFAGQHYRLHDAPFMPRPVRAGGVPIVVGTKGSRMLRVTARYADVWNVVAGPKDVRATGEEMLAACEQVGRDPATLRWSVAAWPNRVGFDPLAEPDRFVDLMGEYKDVGVSEVICMWQPSRSADDVARIASHLAAVR